MVSLAIDIGQTQARVRAVGAPQPSETTLPGFVYGSDLGDAIVRAALAAADRAGLDRIGAVAVGSTGLYGAPPPVEDVLHALHREIGVHRLVVADDAVTAYLGALGDHDGVVVAAGTGLVGLGRGSAGAARVDGVGAMIGDEGAGWWIGREGLIAAIRASDGRRGGSRALLERLEERFGPVGGFPAALAEHASSISVVASFAKDVAEVARGGDSVAREVWARAGSFIGDAVCAAATRAALDDGFGWALLGRLAEADDLLEPGLGAEVTGRFPSARRVAPQGEPLDGVRLLLDADLGPWGSLVRDASSARGVSATR